MGGESPIGNINCINKTNCQIFLHTSSSGSFAKGVAMMARGIWLSFNMSWLQGTLYIVDLMKRGLQFPEI